MDVDEFDRAPSASAHDDVNSDVPTGLNWTLHSAGSASTVTGLLVCAASSAGLA